MYYCQSDRLRKRYFEEELLIDDVDGFSIADAKSYDLVEGMQSVYDVPDSVVYGKCDG